MINRKFLRKPWVVATVTTGVGVAVAAIAGGVEFLGFRLADQLSGIHEFGLIHIAAFVAACLIGVVGMPTPLCVLDRIINR